MFDINGWELIIILVVAAVVIGPERLPEYAAHLRRWVRQLRQMADGAKEQLREQMGPDFESVDWKAYDPRQYDPRRIVREALLEDGPSPSEPASAAATSAATSGWHAAPLAPRRPASFDPDRPTPYDADAT